jgi:hypothetical protein
MGGDGRGVGALTASLALGLALLPAGAQANGAGVPQEASERVRRPQVDERILAQPGSTVNASQVVEEMLEDLAADLASRFGNRLSPLIVEGVTLSPNLNPGYAALLEARLVAALHRTDAVQVVRCFECRSTQVNVEGAVWTARQGLTRRADLAQVADRYGARAVLRAALTLSTDPDALALDVEVTRVEDAAVLFAEGYRYDAGTALLYRGTDAAATRAERRADLQARLDGRPSFGHAVAFGAMSVSSEEEGAGPILGPFASYRLYESFGAYRELRAGLNLGGFIHSSRLAGAVLQASIHRRVNAFSLYGPQLFLGLGGGGFLTGGGGNTAMATFSAELLLGERMMLQASASWIHPFDFAERGAKVGGLTPQAGVGLLW